ncbi:MAG: hypothetical protein GVY18_01015, partial [Bacteroidetes bacterium]|nr:hypothetical protein [Bacteroidota bacterium]
MLVFLASAAPAQAQRSSNPHGPLPEGLDCSACHRTTGWTPLLDSLQFDHDRQTAFPLTGSHTLTTCATCHVDLRFDAPQAAPDDCTS